MRNNKDNVFANRENERQTIKTAKNFSAFCASDDEDSSSESDSDFEFNTDDADANEKVGNLSACCQSASASSQISTTQHGAKTTAISEGANIVGTTEYSEENQHATSTH